MYGCRFLRGPGCPPAPVLHRCLHRRRGAETAAGAKQEVPGGHPSTSRLLQELPQGGRSQAEGGRLRNNADTFKVLGKGRMGNKITMTEKGVVR